MKLSGRDIKALIKDAKRHRTRIRKLEYKDYKHVPVRSVQKTLQSEINFRRDRPENVNVDSMRHKKERRILRDDSKAGIS